MNLSLDRSVTAQVVKAIAEFDLINDGDRIAVGLSGGKDSAFLLLVLKIFSKYFSKDFMLKAVHVDPGFDDSSSLALKDFCQQLKIDLKIIKSEIALYINSTEASNPCSKCAHFRKGAIINYLKQNNFNKLAFGHHLDDAVETYLMSIIYSGQLQTLAPKRFLDKNKVEIIRPLIYLRESVIIREIKKRNIKIKKSLCPYDGNSARAKIKKDFAKYFKDEQLFANLTAAMRKKENNNLWPTKTEEKLLTQKMKKYWK